MNRQTVACRTCGDPTRARTGRCWRCRPAPVVRREGDGVFVDGIGRMTAARALRLANEIADVLGRGSAT